jgi:prevent-host-death family protein
MKTATIRDLRNHYTTLLSWISAGEEVVITRRGKAIARLVPEKSAESLKGVEWSQSAAFQRDRSAERMLTAEESLDLIHESSGRW